jgi:hypothetical protein
VNSNFIKLVDNFSKIKVIENIFDEADVRCRAAVDIDPDLDIDGWKEYEQQAKSNYNKYNGHISVGKRYTNTNHVDVTFIYGNLSKTYHLYSIPKHYFYRH